MVHRRTIRRTWRDDILSSMGPGPEDGGASGTWAFPTSSEAHIDQLAEDFQRVLRAEPAFSASCAHREGTHRDGVLVAGLRAGPERQVQTSSSACTRATKSSSGTSFVPTRQRPPSALCGCAPPTGLARSKNRGKHWTPDGPGASPRRLALRLPTHRTVVGTAAAYQRRLFPRAGPQSGDLRRASTRAGLERDADGGRGRGNRTRPRGPAAHARARPALANTQQGLRVDNEAVGPSDVLPAFLGTPEGHGDSGAHRPRTGRERSATKRSIPPTPSADDRPR